MSFRVWPECLPSICINLEIRPNNSQFLSHETWQDYPQANDVRIHGLKVNKIDNLNLELLLFTWL